MKLRDPHYWEDKYHNVRAERNELGKKCKYQDQTIRLLRTRHTKLENRILLMQRNDKLVSNALSSQAKGNKYTNEALKIDSISFEGRVDPEESDSRTNPSSNDSEEAYFNLQQKHKSLLEKYKSVMKGNQKLKKDTLSLRKRLGILSVQPVKIRGVLQRNQRKKKDIQSNQNKDQSLVCTNIGNELKILREENNGLKKELADLRSTQESNKRNQDAERLDFQNRFAILEERYDNLKTKARELTSLNSEMFKKLEDYNKTIKDLNANLRNSKDIAKFEKSKVDHLTVEAQEQVKYTRTLESKLISLSESRVQDTKEISKFEVLINEKERKISEMKKDLSDAITCINESQMKIKNLQDDKREIKITFDRLEKTIKALGSNSNISELVTARDVINNKTISDLTKTKLVSKAPNQEEKEKKNIINRNLQQNAENFFNDDTEKNMK